MSCEEHRTCEECHDEEASIHAAAVDVTTWAWAITDQAEVALNSTGIADDEDEKRFLDTIKATATAIAMVCNRDIEDVTRVAREPEPAVLHPVPCGDTAS